MDKKPISTSFQELAGLRLPPETAVAAGVAMVDGKAMIMKEKDDKKMVAGYKGFDLDWECLGYQFEPGKKDRWMWKVQYKVLR